MILDSPEINDLLSYKKFEERNKMHLAKWETTSDLNSEKDYESCLTCWENECQEGKSMRFFLKPKANPHLIIGMCNFSQIIRRGFQACYLGYNIDYAYEGKGLMFEAAETAIRFMFEEQQIHRIMANYMPINIRSAKLLARLGFVVEGYAEKYLRINNRWEDHVLNALSFEKWRSEHSFDQIAMESISSLYFRKANSEDVEKIVSLLIQDEFGKGREDLSKSLLENYFKAFIRIISNPCDELIVAELNHELIGFLQISYLQHMTFQGGIAAQIESARIQKEYRMQGYGTQMFQYAINKAKNRGCHRVQLMTDKRRFEAKRFYEKIGFKATHEGMKLFI